jgi:hypothetical protein
MRGGVIVAALLALLALVGCGGGGQPFVADSGLVGVWLQVETELPALHADEPCVWPTRLLAFGASGDFSCEEGRPLETAVGGYLAREQHLALLPRELTGTPILFGANELTYTQFDARLVLTAEIPDAPVRAFAFARTASFTPPALCTDWLLVLRHTREGAELPCTADVRLSITEDGILTLTRSARGEPVQSWAGQLLIAGEGVLGLRVPVSPTDTGGVLLLGAGRTQGGTLTISLPDGVTATFSPRLAPVRDLVGVWRSRAAGSTDTLELASDGRFALTRDGNTETGTWRCHMGGYLALSTTDRLFTLAWALRGSLSPTLTTGQWVTQDGAPPTFMQTSWSP